MILIKIGIILILVDFINCLKLQVLAPPDIENSNKPEIKENKGWVIFPKTRQVRSLCDDCYTVYKGQSCNTWIKEERLCSECKDTFGNTILAIC
jgi:hypothetical protein